MSKSTNETGDRGERLAGEHLRENGYRILETNLENEAGEIDVVAYDTESDLFVFVEVRAGTSKRFAGERSIGTRKKERVTGAAHRFLANRKALDVPHRFDVVGVTMFPDSSRKPEVRHHRGVISP